MWGWFFWRFEAAGLPQNSEGWFLVVPSRVTGVPQQRSLYGHVGAKPRVCQIEKLPGWFGLRSRPPLLPLAPCAAVAGGGDNRGSFGGSLLTKKLLNSLRGFIWGHCHITATCACPGHMRLPASQGDPPASEDHPLQTEGGSLGRRFGSPALGTAQVGTGGNNPQHSLPAAHPLTPPGHRAQETPNQRTQVTSHPWRCPGVLEVSWCP